MNLAAVPESGSRWAGNGWMLEETRSLNCRPFVEIQNELELQPWHGLDTRCAARGDRFLFSQNVMAPERANRLRWSAPGSERQMVSEAAVEAEVWILVRSGIEHGDSRDFQAQGAKGARVEVLHLAVAEMVAAIFPLA